MAVVDREAADLNEARWMRALAQRSLIEKDHLDDHHLTGDFHACVETVCADRGLEPDWSLWDDEAGFAASTPPPPEEAGEVAHDAKRHETVGAQGRVIGRLWLRPSAPSTASRSGSP